MSWIEEFEKIDKKKKKLSDERHKKNLSDMKVYRLKKKGKK